MLAHDGRVTATGALLNEAVLARPGSAGWMTWLSNPTVFLCLVGVLLPNLLSVGSLIGGVGVPPRPAMIAIYAVLVILARFVPPAVIVPIYLLGVVFDFTSTVALLVNLAARDIFYALPLIADLQLFRSPLYVGLAIASVTVVGLNLYLLLTKRDLLRRGNPFVMMGVAAAFGVADYVANTSPHYDHGALYAAGKPMASAADASGFRQAAAAAGPQQTALAHSASSMQIAAGSGRHVLLIVVEALGQFRDPKLQALVMDRIETPALLETYRLETGATTYYGSTTAAEMRELCDTRASYRELLSGKALSCLPAHMAARGYDTVAMHNFTGQMFERTQWYPKIGFRQSIFGEDILKTNAQLCGGSFRGPCDTAMVPLIEQRLQEAGKPTFLYWLTLSTHVPVKPRDGTPRLACDASDRAIGDAEVCYMTEMWMDLFDKLADMIPRLPSTEILIVGDHAPLLWRKNARNLFEPGKVPWLRLTPRDNLSAASPVQK